MYWLFRRPLLFLLRAPSEPPDPPTGSHDQALVFRAAKPFLYVKMVRFVFRTVPALMISMGILVWELGDLAEANPGVIGVVLVSVFAASVLFRYLLVRLDYDLRYYVVTDRSVRIRQGAWRIEESTITFANIQNLTVDQGPLERMLDIANVRIETAGGSAAFEGKQGVGHYGVLEGIRDATEVRDRILRLLRRYRDAGLGDERARTTASGLSAPRARGSALSPEALARLREVRDEARRLELALSRPHA